MANEPLRGCPTCGTKVTDVDLGLRDFSWINPLLPGKVGMMAIDAVLERHGHLLMIEFKPMRAGVGKGATITYKALVREGHDVWVVQGDGPLVMMGIMQPDGHVVWAEEEMNVRMLASQVVKWWMAHE